MAPSRPDAFKRYCVAFGCMNKKANGDSELSYFKIPDDTERRKEWLTAIDREDLLDKAKIHKIKSSFVCSVHFDGSEILTTITRRLKNDAVPTKLLPQKIPMNQVHPQTSKDVSSRGSIKNKKIISTYSHTSAQTDTEAKNVSPKKGIKLEIDENNIDESLNESINEINSSVPSEPAVSPKKEIKLEIDEKNLDESLNESINEHKSTVTSEPAVSLKKEIKLEIDEKNIEELLNESINEINSSVPSEPAISSPQSQEKELLSNNDIKKPEVITISTQTDLKETLNKATQTLSNVSPLKRKLKKEFEKVHVKHKRLKNEILKIEKKNRSSKCFSAEEETNRSKNES